MGFLPAEELLSIEAVSVWKSIPLQERLVLTVDSFTFKVNNTGPRRDYSPAELRPIFEKLKYDLATAWDNTGRLAG